MPQSDRFEHHHWPIVAGVEPHSYEFTNCHVLRHHAGLIALANLQQRRFREPAGVPQVVEFARAQMHNQVEHLDSGPLIEAEPGGIGQIHPFVR